MERAPLEQLLGRGLSLAEIGRRLGVHEATVSYWARRYGLEAVNRARSAARGGLTREQLEALVQAGMSIAQIAQAVDRSKATVRHWLRRHELRTAPGERRDRRREARNEQRASLIEQCRRHGVTEFYLDHTGYYRCKRCRVEAVARRRRKVKEVLVLESGGRCRLCGYDRYLGALQFQHLDPATKSFGVSLRGHTPSLARLRAEARKCVLLCSNCHAEVEGGASSLSG